jgi:hypothetical protein
MIGFDSPSAAIKLWTHHPSDFRIDAVGIRIDPTQGQYWNYEKPGFRYREIAPVLWDKLGTDQFLWCCTQRGMFKRVLPDHDLVEWEIAAPPADVIAYVSSRVWEDLVWSKSDSWDRLIVPRPSAAGDPYIHAAVSFPVPVGCVTCHGQLPLPWTDQQIEEAAELVRNPPAIDPELRAAYDWDAD